MVVDPPRKGCDEALLNTIIDMKPNRVVYVSCNPATLARDLKVLEEGGYKTQEVQPVDMFPHTTHVECGLSWYNRKAVDIGKSIPPAFWFTKIPFISDFS